MLGLYVISGAPISGYEIIVTVVEASDGVFGIPIKIQAKTNPIPLSNNSLLIQIKGNNKVLRLTGKVDNIYLRGIAYEIFLQNN